MSTLFCLNPWERRRGTGMPASASDTCEACWKAPFESVFWFGLQWDKKSLHPTLLYAYLLLEGECTCIQITVFRPWSCLEGYISIWGLYQVHPTACRTLSLWWGAKMFPVWERGLKLYLIWVLIYIPQAYPVAVSVLQRQHWICLFNEIMQNQIAIKLYFTHSFELS